VGHAPPFLARIVARPTEPTNAGHPAAPGHRRRYSLVPHRFSISTATVVMLVLLRLNIGWHFFSEGVKHYSDPHWTSEPVLRNAKGPLAPLYHAYLPDFHGFETLLHGDRSQNESHAVQAWTDEVQADWDAYRQKLAGHYGLNESQQKQATDVLRHYQARIRDWAADHRDALETHVHEWQRRETARETPASELPFQKKRLAEKQALLAGEASGWQAELKALQREYENGLTSLLVDTQRAQSPLRHPVTEITLIDDAMTYAIVAIGLCLLLGLLTPVACVAGAVFLLSVVMMQPFWVSETQPTFNQYVEMFALLTLATTKVGRWGGLDFFLASLIRGSYCSTKGKCDASES
jgi:uncharacterized membrane protein YphA (DoxX/SURF4 family)